MKHATLSAISMLKDNYPEGHFAWACMPEARPPDEFPFFGIWEASMLIRGHKMVFPDCPHCQVLIDQALAERKLPLSEAL